MNETRSAPSTRPASPAATATLVVTRLYSDAGQGTMLGLTVSTFAMVIFLLYGSGQLFWARVIPVSAAIIYSNFAAIFAAMAAGWAWRLPDTPQWRRATLATLLSISSVVAILWPLLSIALRPPPLGGNQWRNRVAMQTSWATCSPAAAATLFRGEGITVSEAELIPLCLTDDSLSSGGGFQAWDTRSSFWDEPTTVALSWVTPPSVWRFGPRPISIFSGRAPGCE